MGYHFERGTKTPRKKSLQKFKDSIRERTRRTSGESMSKIIAGLTPMMRGWFEYFKHSRSWVFPMLDSWIRHRLRSIQKRRQGRQGDARGKDNKRWPNSYFAELGYFSLKAAWNSAASLRK